MVRVRNLFEFIIIWLEKRFDLEICRGLVEIGVNLLYLIGKIGWNGSELGSGEFLMGWNIYRYILKEWGFIKWNVWKILVLEDFLKFVSLSFVFIKLMMIMILLNMFYLFWM